MLYSFFIYFFSILYFSLSPNINIPKINFVSLKTIDKSILISITFISIMTLIVGTTSPPNNWDSMSYHLSKFNTGYKVVEYIFLIQIILDKTFFRH